MDGVEEEESEEEGEEETGTRIREKEEEEKAAKRDLRFTLMQQGVSSVSADCCSSPSLPPPAGPGMRRAPA